jgi:hypothetical protein
MPSRNASRPASLVLRSTPLAALGLVVALAGCGGSGTTKTSSSPTTTAAAAATAGTGANRAALQAFRDCMAKNGSPLPTFAPRANRGSVPPAGAPDNGGTPGAGGGGGGGGRGFGGGGGIGNADTSTDPAVQKAFAACKATLPPGFLQQQQKAQQARAAYNSCMKDHGVTLPTGPPVSGAPTTTIDRTSPTYQQAQAVCGQLLPQRPAGTTSTTTVQ